MRLLRHLRSPLWIVSALALPSLGWANANVDPGYDLFRSASGGCFHSFGAVPIPAGFFDPGSEPFSGVVQLSGQPVGSFPACPLDDLFNIDTILRRPDQAIVPVIPSQDQIPIEIVQLSLVSASPITVTYGGGGSEQWTVTVDLSPTVVPQPQGTEWIYHTAPTGGTFDTYLPIVPRFTFTRIPDNAVRVLDYGVTGNLIEVSQIGAPWSHNTPPSGSCTSNFCASPGEMLTLSGNTSELRIFSVCPQPPVQGDARTWGSMKAIYR